MRVKSACVPYMPISFDLIRTKKRFLIYDARLNEIRQT
jgi:hypothetical protein